jgi:large subunit ribosomal protein L25
MQQVRIEAESRSESGKGAARSLRRAGKLPAVLYGYGDPARMIALDEHGFNLALTHERAEHALINLGIDGSDESLAIVKQVQRHPVRHNVLHVDFQSIRMDEEITVDTEIILDGEPPGVEEGGVLEFVTRAVELRALPQDVPDSIHVNVSGLAIGDTLHVSDIGTPTGVTILTDGHMLLASVAVPRVIEEEVAESELAEGEELEPERVGEDVEGDKAEDAE